MQGGMRNSRSSQIPSSAFATMMSFVTWIVGDVALLGLPISDDTIRRYLKEAREHLSDWQD
jgi:hypothetical protein